MDFRDDAAQTKFREEVRVFLAAEAPREYTVEHKPHVDSYGRGDDLLLGWRKKVAKQGWLAAHWPKEYGGAGLSVMEQFILKEEFALHRVPHTGARSTDMVGPTVILHGSEEQKQRMLPPILSGEHWYSQGFSEPQAGSDLAAVQLKATRDGDEYVLNGQKIWTSNAATCNWMFLLARTDPEAPKHRGISYFVMQQDVPGLDVRPIANMTGGGDLAEVFFDDVRIPVGNRIGEENRGWYVAMTTLDFERSGIAGTVALQQDVLGLVEQARATGKWDRWGSRLADFYVAAEVGRMMSIQIASLQERGNVPNYEASVVKLFSSELGQRFANQRVLMFGLAGILREGSNGHEINDGRYALNYMGVIPSTIAGGTSEIQRNIIATRGLGLPRG